MAAASLHAASDYSSAYHFTTLAGTSSIGSQDGNGEVARFYSPRDVTTDSAGNMFIVDEGNHSIRKVTPAGAVTTLAGSSGIPGSADGSGPEARFDSPQGITSDSLGNLYITDTGNHTIRKITPTGFVTTLAGVADSSGDTDGNGSSARFNLPRGIAIDSDENLYVTESGNDAVRKIAPDGTVTTFVTGLKFPEAADINAFIPLSYGAIAADSTGHVYVSAYDAQNFIRSAHSEYTTYQGHVYQLDPDGTATSLWETEASSNIGSFRKANSASTLAIDPNGQLVFDDNYRLYRYSFADGSRTLIAGDGLIGSDDGTDATAKFGFPLALAYDSDGVLCIADTGNNTVRKLDLTDKVVTVAGLALDKAAATIDGSGTAARFKQPHGIAIDAEGNLYVTDSADNCIRRIAPDGTVTTLAGKPGYTGSADGTGSAALFDQPKGLAIDASGNLFVTDWSNSTIRRVTPSGEVSTFAGTAGESGYDDGTSSEARFFRPNDVAIDPTGNLYIVNSAPTVRKITPTGETTTLAGFPRDFTGYADGQGSAARFTAPQGLAVDSIGNIFVSEGPYSPYIARVRRVSPTGLVTTVVGSEQGSADGNYSEARFNGLRGLTIDAAGNIFIADSYNQTIRKISQSQTNVTTLAGVPDSPGSNDGIGREARFYYPQDVAIDSLGNIYVTSGTTVRKGVATTGPVITTQPIDQSVSPGETAQFSVIASGHPTPNYQWQFNAVNINGATTDTLTINNAQTSNAGNYTVTVSNNLGTITSTAAVLTVTTETTSPTDDGDNSDSNEENNNNGSESGNNSGGSTSNNSAHTGGGGGGGGAPSVWFLLTLAILTIGRWKRFPAKTTAPIQ